MGNLLHPDVELLDSLDCVEVHFTELIDRDFVAEVHLDASCVADDPLWK
jgi:hypothetical protein